MRFGVGLAILGVGALGLGWWASGKYATHIEAQLGHAASEVAAGSVHGVLATVEGRDIHVSGLADGPSEHEALIARFDAIRGRRVVVDGLETLPVAAPFALNAAWLDGNLTTQGHVPTVAARDALARLGAAGLTLAAGAPDDQWARAAELGLAALRQLEEGEMELSGRRMSVTGTALTPDDGAAMRAALDHLPDGYQAELVLSYRDDGTPPAYSLRYTVDAGAWVDGKLPPGVGAEALAGALGLSDIENNADQGILGEAGTVPSVLAALAPWMAEVEALDVNVSPDGIDITAGFGAGADLELLRGVLGTDLGAAQADVALTVTEVGADTLAGGQRTHPITGRTEVLRDGYWLPMADFTPSPETCETEVGAVLEANRIGFVTGSARLDARARSAVNALASVLGPCLRDAGLRAEIGGHTDSTGGDEANDALSLSRAQAVRAALVARGVPPAALTAMGYGATQPVADNDTDTGRAANRRTAVRWIE